jgi:hypothetical protein
MLTLQSLWDNHPYPNWPCDQTLFENQCAIRMTVALNGAGLSTANFRGAKCYTSLGHSPRHILRAQELADWLATLPVSVGTVQKYREKVTSADFLGKRGIVFIQDGWPHGGDHIDLWNGTSLKGGTPDYFERGRQIWFWELP